MTSTRTAPWREDVQRYFDDVADLMVTGDPRVTFLAPNDQAAAVILDRALEVRTRAWNMQYAYSLNVFVEYHEANELVRQREHDHRDLLSVPALEACPLLPNLTVDLRLGWVPAPLLLTDDDHVFLAGPDGTEHQWTIWESTDAEIVSRAHEVYRACWAHARPWHELTDRPLLSDRLLDVALHLAGGQSDREIADDLGVSTRTASAEVRRVIDWCGARSRGHAIAILVGADR